MKARPLRVLHLEDNPRDADIIRDRLEADGVDCDIVRTNSKAGFEAALASESFDLVISDYNLPDYDGITALRTAQISQPDTPVILISGTVGEEEAVKCLQKGATDYLLKGRLDRLAPAVLRALRDAEARRIRSEAEAALRTSERTLREYEERTEFALTAGRIGVWEVNMVNDHLTWSATMAALCGLTVESAPKSHGEFLALVHPDDQRVLGRSIALTMTDDAAHAAEFRALWPDGTAHWIYGSSKAARDDAGRPVRLLGIAMDIDSRKALEEQLRQSQKVEAIGQLAGGIAHDFNNVLTVILGFTELRMLDTASDDPAASDLLEIKKAGMRGVGLTRQLLAFSRKQILTLEVLDLNARIRDMEAMLKLLIVEHVDITTSLLAHDALVEMDATQVEQILVNLAVNAADAMPRGGRLTIATANVRLDKDLEPRRLPLRPGNYVLLSVTDTGTGMSEATSQRIFEPFFTTKDVGKGTGLGLATVFAIVKQGNGDISVRSAPGEGTTFSILLPQVVDEFSTVEPEAPESEQAPACTETILLVEDDEGVRRLTCRALDRAGYRILEASDPVQAIALAEDFAGTIDLMLSDVIMPRSGGLPLFERLGHLRPEIRALYMSGYADEAIQHVLLSDGTPFIHKPFTSDVLLRKVREVLDMPPARLD